LTARAIVGLLGLNLWLLVVGNALLFGLRGWRTWAELGRLLAFGYMLGVAGLGMVWVWQLTLGVDMSTVSIFATGLLVGAIAVVTGNRRGRPLPPLTRPRIFLPRISLLSAVIGALAIVYFEALFRAGRLAGLYEFDAWLFWVPKAQAIYSFGGLDSDFLRELPNAAYPPLVPALEAAAFHFMGSMDVVTLHLQFWFLLVGFVGAAAGLLAGRVQPLLLWLPLLLVLVAPHVVDHALQPQADFLLDELFALAVLLVALWLVERADWMLVAAAPLLGAAMLTKREGYMYAACLVASALIVTVREARIRWARLVPVAALAAAATVPWWLFLKLEDVGGGGTASGASEAFSQLDRAWPSLKLALSTLFDFRIWLVVVPVLLVALATAAASGARLLPSYAALIVVCCVAGLTWNTWAFPVFPFTKEAALNPIVRVSGGLVLSSALLIPLLLQAGRAKAEAR
jgi:hypothetical protein